MYGLPCFEYDDYRCYADKGVNYTKVIQRIFRDGAEWRMHNDNPVTFKKSDFCDDEKKWAEFVVAKLMSSSHATDITKDKAMLIYFIMTRKTIDVGELFTVGSFELPHVQSVALPFPNVITELCRFAGVTWENMNS